jgi:hypothetical protein
MNRLNENTSARLGVDLYPAMLQPVVICGFRFALRPKKGTALILAMCRSLFRPSLVVASAVGWSVAGNAQVPVDVIGTLPVADYNTFIAPQAYNDWGNEPVVAINPTDPGKIVISSFAFDTGYPIGASLWYSTDGGNTWGLRFPITKPPQGLVPADQFFAYDSAGVLHGVLLAAGNIALYHGSTADPNKDGVNGRPASTWSWTATAINNGFSVTPDQPWMAVGGSNIFIAWHNFTTSGDAAEERVATSLDNGMSFTMDVAIGTPGRLSTKYRTSPDEFINPGTRIAADGHGKVYAIFGFATNSVGGIPIMQYRLNRGPAGDAWDFTSSNLPIGGLPIDSGTSSQGTDPALRFGAVNALLGNITAIATDKNGAHIYAVYGKQVGGVDRLLLAEFHDDGMGSLVERANPVACSVAGQRAALPSVAVTDDGTVYILYDTFTSGDGQFHVHLTRSSDQGMTFASGADRVLDDFTAPFAGQKILGDYQYLTSLSNTVYGTFAGRGLAAAQNQNGIDRSFSIDPFFFSFTLQPPPQLTIVASGTNVILSWPTNAVGFTLQSTTNLGGAWSTNSPAPIVIGGQNVVTNPLSGPQRFYRLKQ